MTIASRMKNAGQQAIQTGQQMAQKTNGAVQEFSTSSFRKANSIASTIDGQAQDVVRQASANASTQVGAATETANQVRTASRESIETGGSVSTSRGWNNRIFR